ncbi:type 1 glutamine amidotransferase family protein [Microvirga sp. W0021]|uniref:Type 1 glutamine amidotransferase family protein n=1 Tax=Hohaiivirga grylli TaxID=3133970 RepID=A0ABV0BKK9_9HYPH
MRRGTVHLAVYDTMSDWEVGYVAAYINSPEFQKEPGRFQIRTVGKSPDHITSKGGLKILPDISLDMLSASDSCMLIIPGGDIAASGGIADFVVAAEQFLKTGIPVAAICGATAALAQAGLLNDIPHTSNAKAFLETTGYKGAEYYREEPAVTAGNLITASGVAPVEFALEIFRKLDLYTERTLNSWKNLYKYQKAEGFFELFAEQAEKGDHVS